MANQNKHPPVLSLAERDRRWANVRKLMRERGLEGLLVAGFRSREMYETYISDDYNEGCVIFPLEGDPVVITWAYLRVMRARWSAERGNRALGRRLSRFNKRHRRRRGAAGKEAR